MKTFLLPALFTLLMLGPSQAMDKQLSDVDLAAKGKAATVLVEIGQSLGFASAFCVDDRGFYITNFHVVQASGTTVNLILSPGEKAQKRVVAKVIRQDQDFDLALLKTEDTTKLIPIKLGTEESLMETAEVIVFGFPFGKDLALNPGEYPSISVNKGHVTALRKKEGTLSRIQIDAVVNPGNSGGPVLDKNGELVGVIVSGIVGAGAVNFAIPVSHVKKFLSKPAIAFTLPTLTAVTLGDMLEFKATLAASPLSNETYALELLINGQSQPERRFDMKPVGGVYSVKAVPLPGKKDAGVRLSATFADGQISGVVGDLEFIVGARSIKLGEAATIKPGANGLVVQNNGQTLEGPVRKLDAVPIKIGVQTLTVNLCSATEIVVSGMEASVELTFTVIAKSAGKEVARTDGKVEFGGAVSPPSVVTAGPKPALGSSKSSGIASLEELIEGRFVRPAITGTRSTYLKVLSTSGDYIGQGKRYEYDSKVMDFKPAEGLVSVHVDNWRLEIAPGKGRILKVGEYENAKRYPFNDTMPGINFSGNGRGANAIDGKFVIWEFVIQGGKVTNLAIDFIQRSESKTAAPLVGMLRYNSNFK